MWTDISSILSKCTGVTDRQTDRQTDKRTEFSSLDRVCIACSAVKTISDENKIAILLFFRTITDILSMKVDYTLNRYTRVVESSFLFLTMCKC